MEKITQQQPSLMKSWTTHTALQPLAVNQCKGHKRKQTITKYKIFLSWGRSWSLSGLTENVSKVTSMFKWNMKVFYL